MYGGEIMLPNDVKTILNTLLHANYEAYVVGGAVRDVMLNKEPHDWDITTNARPEEVKCLFEKTIDTGLKHGTVTVMLNNTPYEITTYRVDGVYSDGRHPDKVAFSSQLRDDLSRRDFTINALAMDINENVVDLFDGKSDLKNGLIKTVGKADERFQEDALRMLRAIRFSAKLGFTIEENTYEAIKRNANLMTNISQERITAEILNIFNSPNPDYINHIYETGLYNSFLPEMNTFTKTDTLLFAIAVNLTKDIDVRLALLFTMFDVDREQLMRRLKFSNQQIKTILTLIEDATIPLKTKASIRKYIASRGLDFAMKMLDYKSIQYHISVQKENEIMQEVVNDKSSIALRDLAINGNDLLHMGYKGATIKELLNKAYDYVLENPDKNHKEDILHYILTKAN